MTTAVTQIRQPLTDAQAQATIASWPDLLNLQIQTQSQADQITADVQRLSTPATKQWISGRVATLLSQYFVSSVPDSMMAAIAEDWHEELKAYPSWAITKAVRWWMSSSNPERRKKPVPGDIAAMAKREVGAVSLAKNAVKRFGGSMPTPPVKNDSPPLTAESARAISEAAGYRPKRMGGE